jgi:hypothetical protein
LGHNKDKKGEEHSSYEKNEKNNNETINTNFYIEL